MVVQSEEVQFPPGDRMQNAGGSITMRTRTCRHPEAAVLCPPSSPGPGSAALPPPALSLRLPPAGSPGVGADQAGHEGGLRGRLQVRQSGTLPAHS